MPTLVIFSVELFLLSGKRRECYLCPPALHVFAGEDGERRGGPMRMKDEENKIRAPLCMRPAGPGKTRICSLLLLRAL